MNPYELRRTGKKLYGEDWKSQLAVVLPAADRTIRSWLSGERKIRPVIANCIRALAAEAERGRR
jgi:hypothetical protein